MKSIIRVISVILVLVMCIFAFMGCGNNRGTSASNNSANTENKAEKQDETIKSTDKTEVKKQYRFTFVSPCTNNQWWVMAEEGMRAACKDLSVDTNLIGPPDVNIDEQIKAMETAISQKVDGIFTCAVNPDTFAPVINKAVDAGIPVVLMDSDSPKSKRIAFAGTNNREGGRQVGRKMAELTNGKATVAILTEMLDNFPQNERIEGFKEVLKDYPEMKVVALEADNADILKGVEKVQAMLRANPNINAIFGIGAPDIIAIGKVVEEMGLVGKITVIGFDDVKEQVDLLRKGVVHALVVQQPFKQAYTCVRLLKEYKDNGSVKEDEKIIDTGTVLVTKENIDTYKADLKK